MDQRPANLEAAVRALIEDDETYGGLDAHTKDQIARKAARQSIDRMNGGRGSGFEIGDGYDWIRSSYAVDPKIGQRVRVQHGGKMATLLPTPYGSHHYLHVLIDGHQHASLVHPGEVDYTASITDLASDTNCAAALAYLCLPEPEFLESYLEADRDDLTSSSPRFA